MTCMQISRRWALVIVVMALPSTGGAQQPASTPLPKVTRPVATTPGSHAFLAASHDLSCVLVPGGVTLLPFEGEDAGLVQSIGLGRRWQRQREDSERAVCLSNSRAATGRSAALQRSGRRRAAARAALGLVDDVGYTHDHILERGDAWVGITRRMALPV
jgi:hypothetical protein